MPQPSITVILVKEDLGRSDLADYEELFRTGAPVLWRTIFAYTAGRRDIADEAVAEAFARALERQDSIRSPLPWIYRTAFRVALGEMKRRTDRLPEDLPGEDAPTEHLHDLLAALRKLSPSQRAAVALHYHADLSVKDVSLRMGTSVAAVKVHLFRGRAKLRRLMGPGEEEERYD
jgi:RNA polymerase sigma-70 factor (ECF subfamily)